MMSSGIPRRIWFSSHSNVWSSVVSVRRGNKGTSVSVFCRYKDYVYSRAIQCLLVCHFLSVGVCAGVHVSQCL